MRWTTGQTPTDAMCRKHGPTPTSSESGTYTVHFKQALPNAIEAVGIDNAPSATVCDLQGRKVNNKRHLHSGVYIVNRHKQIVK